MSQTHNPSWGSWDVGPTPIGTYTSNLQSLIKRNLLVVSTATMRGHVYSVNTGDFKVEEIDTETSVSGIKNFCMTIRAEDVGSDEKQVITVLLTETQAQLTHEFTYEDIHDVENKFLKEFTQNGVFLPYFGKKIKVKLNSWCGRGRIEPQQGLVNSFGMVVPFEAWLQSGEEVRIKFL